MTRFLLIRHAVTDAIGKNLSGRMAGIHLNEEGEAQAQDLAHRLAVLPIEAIYCSPVDRARQTAEPIAKVLQLQTIMRTDFQEIDYGEWTGETITGLSAQPQFALFNSFRSNTRIPGGETMLEAQARFISGLQKLAAKHMGRTVAVVSHSDMIKAALAFYLGIPLDMMQRIEISPASVSLLELYEETARVLLVNEVGGIRF